MVLVPSKNPQLIHPIGQATQVAYPLLFESKYPGRQVAQPFVVVQVAHGELQIVYVHWLFERLYPVIHV